MLISCFEENFNYLHDLVNYFRTFGCTVEGVDCGDEASDWIGSIIKKANCRLLYHAASKTKRRTVTTEKFPLMIPEDTVRSLYIYFITVVI